MGELFTLKPFENEPNDNQIWVRGHYDRTSRTYSVYNYADVNRERFLEGGRTIYQ